MTTATEKLQTRFNEGKHLCIGLDSDYTKLPASLVEMQYRNFQFGLPSQTDQNICGAIYTFNKAIVNATKDLVAAYKPNLAFYLKSGIAGITALIHTCEYISRVAPGVLIILDAKFGDIGNTNLGYADFAFNQVKADALTIHSYMGQGANQVFLDHSDKLFFVLCRTSNIGANEFQDLPVVDSEGNSPWNQPLFRIVASNVENIWNENYNCGLVIGATAPDEIAEVRKVATTVPLLIPGIGAQGGELETSVTNALTQAGGFLINSSRGIIFASNGEDFADAAFAATEDLNTQIRGSVAATNSQKGWS